jgi:hypothetical protein
MRAQARFPRAPGAVNQATWGANVVLCDVSVHAANSGVNTPKVFAEFAKKTDPMRQSSSARSSSIVHSQSFFASTRCTVTSTATAGKPMPRLSTASAALMLPWTARP